MFGDLSILIEFNVFRKPLKAENIFRGLWEEKPIPWKGISYSLSSSKMEDSVKLEPEKISQIEPEIKEILEAIVDSMNNLVEMKEYPPGPEWGRKRENYLQKHQKRK